MTSNIGQKLNHFKSRLCCGRHVSFAEIIGGSMIGVAACAMMDASDDSKQELYPPVFISTMLGAALLMQCWNALISILAEKRVNSAMAKSQYRLNFFPFSAKEVREKSDLLLVAGENHLKYYFYKKALSYELVLKDSEAGNWLTELASDEFKQKVIDADHPLHAFFSKSNLVREHFHTQRNHYCLPINTVTFFSLLIVDAIVMLSNSHISILLLMGINLLVGYALGTLASTMTIQPIQFADANERTPLLLEQGSVRMQELSENAGRVQFL